MKVVLFCLVITLGLSAAADPNPVEVVEQMEHDFGVHHGFRRNHAKGICAVGEFTATPEAKDLSRAVIFDGKPHKVLARLSAAGGLPDVADTIKNPHGLALQFDTGAGATHNMSMINVPVFIAKTPQAFLDFLRAGKPEEVQAYMKKYPESKPFLDYVTTHNPPESYATSSYYSLNAFKFINAKNEEQFVRWQFVPSAGEKFASDAELKKAGSDFLENEIKTRLKKAPATFEMVATVANKGDTSVDSTIVWTGDHKTVKMGALKLTLAVDQAQGQCNKVNYDPTHVSDGVTLSEDPVLKFRSPAYAVSFGKRLSDPKDPAPAKDRKAKAPTAVP